MSSNVDTSSNSTSTNISAKKAIDSGRFVDGVVIKGKLFGIEDVKEETGDDICNTSMVKLRAILAVAKKSKQPIFIKIQLDGIEIIDQKTNEILHKHSVERISYIARDLTDARAFGYIFKNSKNELQYIGLRTEKPSSEAVLALKDLFEVVYELKKLRKEQEKENQTLVATTTTATTAATNVATIDQSQSTETLLSEDLSFPIQNVPIQNAPVQNVPIQNAPVQNPPIQNSPTRAVNPINDKPESNSSLLNAAFSTNVTQNKTQEPAQDSLLPLNNQFQQTLNVSTPHLDNDLLNQISPTNVSSISQPLVPHVTSPGSSNEILINIFDAPASQTQTQTQQKTIQSAPKIPKTPSNTDLFDISLSPDVNDKFYAIKTASTVLSSPILSPNQSSPKVNPFFNRPPPMVPPQTQTQNIPAQTIFPPLPTQYPPNITPYGGNQFLVPQNTPVNPSNMPPIVPPIPNRNIYPQAFGMNAPSQQPMQQVPLIPPMAFPTSLTPQQQQLQQQQQQQQQSFGNNQFQW